jgi:hypothetical protein
VGKGAPSRRAHHRRKLENCWWGKLYFVYPTALHPGCASRRQIQSRGHLSPSFHGQSKSREFGVQVRGDKQAKRGFGLKQPLAVQEIDPQLADAGGHRIRSQILQPSFQSEHPSGTLYSLQ